MQQRRGLPEEEKSRMPVRRWCGAVVSVADYGPRVPGSKLGRVAVRCGLQQVTCTPAYYWLNPGSHGRTTDLEGLLRGWRLRCALLYVLSPRDLVSRPDNMDETVPHTHMPVKLSNSELYIVFISNKLTFDPGVRNWYMLSSSRVHCIYRL